MVHIEDKGFDHFLCQTVLPKNNDGWGNLVEEVRVKGNKRGSL